MNGLSLKRNTVLLLVTLLLPLWLLACSDSSAPKRKSGKAHLINVATVKNIPMKSQQLLSGTLEAKRTVQIFNQEEGLILSILAFQGDRVSKGSLLVELDSKLIRAETNKAIISHRQAALDLKRIQQLRKKRLTTEEALSNAQSTLDLALAEKTVLNTRLQHTKIVSPFDGVISQRLKEPGDVIAKFSHILTLADVSQLKARVYVSELLLPNIKLGTELKMRIDALGNTLFPATISRIYPTIDKTTRQGTIEITLNNPPALARPGQLCRIILSGQTTSRLHVPLKAVKHNVNGSYVYKVSDNKVELIQVTTGIQLGADIEIISGLTANDKVVTQGFLGLKPNKPVKIIKDKK